jgi:broad specificity polyphosphatase/5'/3'-nucleotidase SurE
MAAAIGATILGAGAMAISSRAQGAAPAAVEGDLREKSATRVKAAEQLVQSLQTELDVGNVPLTPDFVERKLMADRRLAEARTEAADDRDARLQAAEVYVEGCRNMLKMLKLRKGQDVVVSGVAQGNYFLADAEYLLAKLRAGK